MSAPSSYAWFTDWVDQRLALTLTVAPSTAAGMLAAFASAGFDLGVRSFDEADDVEADVVRIGSIGGWTYAVEHFTCRGTDRAVLERLTAAGGLAVAVSYTQTISVLMVARDGALITGFDVVVPSIRNGSDPHAYDREMLEAGFLGANPERGGAPAARFIELTTGFVVTRGMLEDPLPCATLG